MFAVEIFPGPRTELLSLFHESDDSSTAIEAYIDQGEVLVARNKQGRVIGHIQLIESPMEWEIKSLAVAQLWRGQGIGSALMHAPLERARSKGAIRVAVATATADIGNIRFYQRLGFRMHRIEPDAFTRERGYSNTSVGGIPVRDRVWFSLEFRPGRQE